MSKTKLIFTGPYPEPNNGISYFMGKYMIGFKKKGYHVSNLHIYFLKHKWHCLKWLMFIFNFDLFNKTLMIHHTPTINGPFLPLFLLIHKILQTKIILVSHEVPSTYSKYLHGVLKHLYEWYEKKIRDWSQYYLVHTRYHYREMRDLGKGHDVMVIPHAIITNFTKDQTIKKKLLTKYDI